MRLENTEGRRAGNQTVRYAPMPQQKKSQDNLNPQIAQIYADANHFAAQIYVVKSVHTSRTGMKKNSN
jgi:hypothetical protein